MMMDTVIHDKVIWLFLLIIFFFLQNTGSTSLAENECKMDSNTNSCEYTIQP